MQRATTTSATTRSDSHSVAVPLLPAAPRATLTFDQWEVPDGIRPPPVLLVSGTTSSNSGKGRTGIERGPVAPSAPPLDSRATQDATRPPGRRRAAFGFQPDPADFPAQLRREFVYHRARRWLHGDMKRTAPLPLALDASRNPVPPGRPPAPCDVVSAEMALPVGARRFTRHLTDGFMDLQPRHGAPNRKEHE